MNPVLNHDLFFVKEHRNTFKVSNSYDILDVKSKEVIMNCKEEIGFGTKFMRTLGYKKLAPFKIVVKTANGEPVLTVKRGFSLFLSKVEVFDEHNNLVGQFKQKFNLGAAKFDVLDPSGHTLCTLKGEWSSWDFKFANDKEVFALVTKKWAGLGKELFSTADNYMLKIDPSVGCDTNFRVLILAAVMCIDIVLKS